MTKLVRRQFNIDDARHIDVPVLEPGQALEHRDGIPWFEAPKPFRIHRHRWQTRGVTTTIGYFERCACGAARHTRGWFFIGNDKPRVRYL